MLISFFALVLFAQWSVYAARAAIARTSACRSGWSALVGLAIVNAQAYVYNRMALAGGRLDATRRCSTPSPGR